MKILVDENIVLAEKAFSSIGYVKSMNGSAINSAALADCDVLVTRTTTKVDRNLLQSSIVKFVATATAGTDHIELDYLADCGVGFTSAAGCNSIAVAEYVINALLRLSDLKSIPLPNKTLGIIGAGNAGKALKQKAECIGLNCLLNDPPLAQQTKDLRYIDLEDLLAQSDIISLHVPLTFSGAFPTYHLIDEMVLNRIKPGTILLNTSRGGVIKESVLPQFRDRLAGLVLDVWENEPTINFDTINLADIATPHIAGYSLDGKYKATEIVYQNTCAYFQLEPTWISPRQERRSPRVIIPVDTKEDRLLAGLVKQTYDVFSDDEKLRQIVVQQSPESYFRSLRNQYEFRQEFSNFMVKLPPSTSIHTRQQLLDLGFTTS